MVMLRAMVLTLAFALVLVAGALLPFARAQDQQRAVAARLFMQGDAPPGLVTATWRASQDSPALAGCAVLSRRHGMLAAAWQADRLMQAGRYDILDEWTAEAVRLARETIRCEGEIPLALLVLARFSTVRGGWGETSLEAIRTSYRVAPREAWLNLRRAEMLMPLRQWLEAEDLERLLRVDLVHLVESGAEHAAARLLRTAEPSFQRRAGRIIASLPFEVQRRYQRAALAMQVDVSELSIPPNAADRDRGGPRDGNQPDPRR